jgi:predicted PurR-regulated permease PerM
MRISPFARRVITVLALTAAAFLLLGFAWQVAQALLLLFASVLVALFLSGTSSWINYRTRIPYGWCLLLVVLAIILIVSGLSVFLARQLIQQARQLYKGLADTAADAREWIEQFAWGERLIEQAAEGGAVHQQVQPALQVLGSITAVVAGAIVVVVIGLYLAASPDHYKNGLVYLVPPRHRHRAHEVLEALGKALRGWLLAQFVSMAVIGTLVAIGLWFFGIEMWLILGVIAGLLTFVPNLGPIIAGVPPTLIALNQSPTVALGVVAYFTAVQMLEGYVVTPMVQDRMIHLPPAGILAAQVLMAYSLGLLGVAMAAPLLAASMVVIQMLYIRGTLEDRSVEVTGQDSGM